MSISSNSRHIGLLFTRRWSKWETSHGLLGCGAM